jgi:iron complex outermembrane receptor protein
MRRSIFALFLFGELVVPALGARAADSSVTAGPDRPDQIEEVLVTARKVSEDIQRVPIAVTVLDTKELAQRSINNIIDLQQAVPNLILQTMPNEPQALTLAIRGQKQNDTTLTLDPSVGLYIDGLYHPRTYGLRGALVDLDQVEVLRGPQGTLFGRNTTGGALDIKSKDPTDQLGGSIDASGGNFGGSNVIAIANVPLGSNTALRVVAQHGRHSGWGEDADGRSLNAERTTYLRAKLKTQFGDNVTASLSGSYSESKNSGGIFKLSGLAPAARGLPPGGVSTLEAAAEGGGLTPAGIGAALGTLNNIIAAHAFPGAPGFYGTSGTFPEKSYFRSVSTHFDVTAHLPADITLRSITGYENLYRATASDLDGTPFGLINGPLNADNERYASQEFQLLGGAPELNWVAGVYAGDESGRELNDAVVLVILNPTNPTQFKPKVHNGNQAVFGQANWEFAPGWRLTGGIRESHDNRSIDSSNTNATGCVVPAPGVKVTGEPRNPLNGPSQCPRKFSTSSSAPSWLISLDDQILPSAMVYAKVSRGYRTGGINFRGSNTEESFSPFAPETVTEYEAGVKSQWFDHRVRLNLAAFHDDYKNIQRSVSIATFSGVPSTVVTNATSAKINGMELEAAVRISPEFTVEADAGLTDAYYGKFVDVTGDRSHESFGIPKWTAGASARYERSTPLGLATARVDFRYQTGVILEPSTPTPDETRQAGYGLLNARLTLGLAKDLDVAVFGRNLAAIEYNVSSVSVEGALGYNYVLPGEPRTFGAEFIKRFGAL